jgi:hypothetical protein
MSSRKYFEQSLTTSEVQVLIIINEKKEIIQTRSHGKINNESNDTKR